jgi:hypothetical protein
MQTEFDEAAMLTPLLIESLSHAWTGGNDAAADSSVAVVVLAICECAGELMLIL